MPSNHYCRAYPHLGQRYKKGNSTSFPPSFRLLPKSWIETPSPLLSYCLHASTVTSWRPYTLCDQVLLVVPLKHELASGTNEAKCCTLLISPLARMYQDVYRFATYCYGASPDPQATRREYVLGNHIHIIFCFYASGSTALSTENSKPRPAISS